MKENTKREKALLLYLNGKAAKEISEILTVKTPTVHKWISRGDWPKLYDINRTNAALNYVTDLLKKEMERNPEEAHLINGHLLVIRNALTDPSEVIKSRISKALKDIEKVLKANLI